MTDETGDAPAPRVADRRAFLRRLSGQAIDGATRIGGMSQVVRRSVEAAGEAVTHELRPVADDSPAADDGDRPRRAAAPTPAPSVGHRDATPGAAPQRSPAREATPALSPEQRAHLLIERSATLAVNDPSGHPHVTSSWFHWDGEVLRLPTGFFTARGTNIARDPRVSVVVEGSGTGSWVAITGTAELVVGPAAAEASRPLLEKYRPAEEPDAAWAELDRAGDQAVVIVRPVRFTWRLG